MKISNKDVIQSYILTTAKYDYSVYEKRILYKLVESCQYLLKGQKLEAKITMDKTLFGLIDVTIPISLFLLDEKDKN